MTSTIGLFLVSTLITLSPFNLATAPLAAAEETADRPGEKRIAVIASYYAARAHANAIATHYFLGFPLEDGLVPPRVNVASIYIDQPAPTEIDTDTNGRWEVGQRLAEMHGVEVYDNIADALTLGGDELAVDGIVYIGVHGEFIRNRFGLRMYQRMNQLDQMFRVFDASGRSAPIFNDVALAYSWRDARWIYDRARELEVPMMAGSVLPFAWRDPDIEHPVGAQITEAVAIGYGPHDAYTFHALEILQSMIERRAGGETGVESVQALQGPSVWEAADEGKFSMALVEAASDAIRDKRGETAQLREQVSDPFAVLINYRDGTRGTVLMLGGFVSGSWAYAADADGETVAAEFILHDKTAGGEHMPYAMTPHFGHLSRNVEEMFITGQPQTPIERTLLTTSVLDVAFRSLHADGATIETPFLDIEYSAEGYQPTRVRQPLAETHNLENWPPEEYEFILWRRQLIEKHREIYQNAE